MTERNNCRMVDRSNWPKGKWDEEPDRVDWTYMGYSCFVQRNDLGAWCGYVGVPVKHPAYGKDFMGVQVSVHGGLSYSDKCQGHVCHTPEPGMPDDVWWLGFDCGHGGDMVPGMEGLIHSYGIVRNISRHYRDVTYALRETRNLAKQLKEMERP